VLVQDRREHSPENVSKFWIRQVLASLRGICGTASLGFAWDPKGERDTKNFVCVPATGQVNRL
jgi:hypothetical protein